MSDSSSDNGGQGVLNRRFAFCKRIQANFSIPAEAIRRCPNCLCCYSLCCRHAPSADELTVCHHYRLVFTDGACLSDGNTVATAGLGVAMGDDPEFQQSVRIDDDIDPFPKRSSQRAELLAALHGLRFIASAPEPTDKPSKSRYARQDIDPDKWIITTDSEYVVKGMTEWFPTWKANDWRGSQGRPPANLDLFQKLDAEIVAIERTRKIEIGFWHVPRTYNQIADKLSKAAARLAPPVAL